MKAHLRQISEDRLLNMLASALGEAAGRLLLEPEVVELMLNADSKLWIDRLGVGRSFTGHSISPADAERVIFLVASGIGAVCNDEQPLLSAELPGTGARFQGILPPLVSSPIFTIRKKAIRIFSLDDYVNRGILSEVHRRAIESAALERQNILIVGGTGSGKTTLANAVLEVIARCDQRLVIIEDTNELQCSAEDCLILRTKDETATMTDLLRATMRLRPDRIIIGEVRGKEALDLLKAWNTGHPGGCATVHADSAAKGLTRLEQLVEEAGVSHSKSIISEAVNLIVYLEKVENTRRVKEVIKVRGLQNEKYQLESI